MRTGAKTTAFAAALAVTFGLAYGVGGGMDPLRSDPAPAAHGGHGGKDRERTEEHGEGGTVSGLRISADGYTLDLATPRLTAGEKDELRFTLRDADGEPVTDYRREHGKELHLILASRDLTTYRHLHPVRAGDGTWRTEAELPRAGDYRAFADFTPDRKGAEGLTLGADLAVSGDYEARELPEVSRTATVDGYTVTLDGALAAGSPSELRFSVTRHGEPVTDLQPYLGAYGHLVALRAGDLAYLHVHPHGEPGDGRTRSGPEISFTATAPGSSAYRLFLDFRHDGEVRTAAFTVRTGDAPANARPEESGAHGDDGHGH